MTGNQVTALMSSLERINNVFVGDQCGEKQSTFLGKTADLISAITQIGALSPNPDGTAIALGGSALSVLIELLKASLRIDSTLLMKCEGSSHRATFIKATLYFL